MEMELDRLYWYDARLQRAYKDDAEAIKRASKAGA
jgi:hypothetical protein